MCDSGYIRSDVDDDIGEDFYLSYLSAARYSSGNVVEGFFRAEEEILVEENSFGYGQILTCEELDVLADNISKEETKNETFGPEIAVVAAVGQVISDSLKTGFSYPAGVVSREFTSAIAREKVNVPPDVVNAGYGPVSGCVRRLFGNDPDLGLVLAWYARAVSYGYAGPVKLCRSDNRWFLHRGEGDPVQSLRDILAVVGTAVPYQIDKSDKEIGDGQRPGKSEDRKGHFRPYIDPFAGCAVEVSVEDTKSVCVQSGACLLVPYLSGWERVVVAIAKGTHVHVHSLGSDLSAVQSRAYLPRGNVAGVHCGFVTRELLLRLHDVGIRNVTIVADELGDETFPKTVCLGHDLPRVLKQPIFIITASVIVIALGLFDVVPWYVLAFTLFCLYVYLARLADLWFLSLEVD